MKSHNATNQPLSSTCFRYPPAEHRVIQYSGHDGSVLPVDRMREWGIGGVMLFHSSADYLNNEQSWTHMRQTMELARSAGMQVWVADDNGYPSGQAGGRVVEIDPAFELRGLRQICRMGEGRSPVQIDLPHGADRFVAACLYPMPGDAPDVARGRVLAVSPKAVSTQGLQGRWMVCAWVTEIIREGTQSESTMQQFRTNGRYPNLLNAQAMETFVRLTHEAFARRFGRLSDLMDLFYTNEPNLMTLWFHHRPGERPNGLVYVPWDVSLPSRFRRIHGYDLIPRLPHLYTGASDEARLTRRHFYETIGALFAENYTRRIARWCERHGIRSGGHLLLEERMSAHVICSGNFLRVISEQHVPGCDVPMPDEGAYWNVWMPKYLSAAAQLRDRSCVSALLDPIIDRQTPTLKPSLRDLQRICNMAAWAGATQFCTYIHWHAYTPEEYRQFNAHIGRLSLLLRGAHNAAPVAMYYPIESFQAGYMPSAKMWSDSAWNHLEAVLMRSQHAVADALTQAGHDFCILDGEGVCEGVVRDGLLQVRQQRYAVVIMPRVELLPLRVLRQLQRFQRAGGRVFWVDGLPVMGDSVREHAQIRRELAREQVLTADEVVRQLDELTPTDFDVRVSPVGHGVFMGRYRRPDGRLTFLVNNTPEAAELTLTASDASDASIPVRLYDPQSGSVHSFPLPHRFSLGAWCAVGVLEDGPAR